MPTTVKSNRGNKSARISIINRSLCELFYSFGWREFKRGEIKLPRDLDMRHWLRGQIDGDGLICYNKKYLLIGYVGPHLAVVEFIKDQIDRMADLVPEKRKVRETYRAKSHYVPIFSVTWCGRDAVKIGKKLYLNQTRCLARKFEKMKPYIFPNPFKTERV